MTYFERRGNTKIQNVVQIQFRLNFHQSGGSFSVLKSMFSISWRRKQKSLLFLYFRHKGKPTVTVITQKKTLKEK